MDRGRRQQAQNSSASKHAPPQLLVAACRSRAHRRMCPASLSPLASAAVRLSQIVRSTGPGRQSARSYCRRQGKGRRCAGVWAARRGPQWGSTAAPGWNGASGSGRRRRTTCAWPRLRKRTVRRRGPTRPPLLAFMNTMSGVSAGGDGRRGGGRGRVLGARAATGSDMRSERRRGVERTHAGAHVALGAHQVVSGDAAPWGWIGRGIHSTEQRQRRAGGWASTAAAASGDPHR